MFDEAQFSFSLSEMLAKIPVSALWIALLVFIVLSLVAGAALLYHWNRYKLHSPAIDMTRLVYLLGIFLLIALCATSLVFFNA